MSKKQIVCLLYDGYEILDLFGPLEFFYLTERMPNCIGYEIHFVGQRKGRISANLPNSTANFAYCENSMEEFLLKNPKIDILLLPGGVGARTLVNDEKYIELLTKFVEKSESVFTVCTGSAILAKTPFLNGKQATSNKLSFEWVKQQNTNVIWKNKARWVIDGNIWTSSGIAAGMDMALERIKRDFSLELAQSVAKRAEYVWNQDSENDLFAARL